MELNKIGENAISIMKDPFKKSCITDIIIHITTNRFDDNDKYCYANVEFKNGKTTGVQKIGNHKDFKVLMTELQAFVDSLENDK